MRLAIIPARGGSKRIPRKNIRSFMGKPLISYSIQAAVDAGCFDKIVVSTDDEEVAEISVRFGAEVPFLRPSNLADDYTNIGSVLSHSLARLIEEGLDITQVCCLYANAPLIQASDVRKGLDLLESCGTPYVIPVTTFKYPIQRALKIEENRLKMFSEQNYHVRSQDLEESYHDAAQFFWGTIEAMLEQKEVYRNATPMVLPRFRVQDIDTMEDWAVAETLYRLLEQSKEEEKKVL